MAMCTVNDCEEPVTGHGFCSKHYQRWRSHGDPSIVLKPYGRRLKPTCNVEGCDRTTVARGMCGKHYQRWAKYGDALSIKQDRDQTPQERFWSRVDKNGPIPEHCPELGPCWVWTGGLAEGYGAFWLDGRQERAHIVAYTWAKGEIAEGHERDHLCRNRACVRPDHLEAVEHWTNVARGISPHGVNAAKTHCNQGHPFDTANTYINPKGARVCRACARARHDRWAAKKRAAKKQLAS
ncbi:HNH endonuclease signature motif containing protein [Streptomyces sp. NPDC055966]|uniref:HNH endonuclease signature motif containing protein n=1 Tax=Streptomyces sp. NPDC055966 TaxID=3345669 RepID=UPI0035DBE2A1